MNKISGMRWRILRAVGAEALGQILNIGIRLLLVPLFLSAWGGTAYGEWLILTAVAAWFGLGDLGGQLYFVNRLTVEWATGKLEEFQRVLSTGLLLFLLSSGVLFGVVLLGLTWTPFIPWLGLKSVGHDLANTILLLMALRFLIALPTGLFLGVYRAIGAQATSVMYGNLMLMIQLIASAVALLAGAGMLFLAALEILPLLVVSVFLSWDLRRRLPKEIRLFDFGKADRSIFFSSILPSFHFLGIQLTMALMIQGSVLVVAKTLGPVEVAIFSSMRTVSNTVSRFMAMLSHAAWPEMTRLATIMEDEKLTQLFRVILNLAFFAGLCYLVLMGRFGEILYHWWLNHKLPYNHFVMFLMACQVVITILWTFGGNLLMATNRHEEYALFQFPVNLLALLLCYCGAIGYGLPGAVTGLIAGQSLLMLIIVVHLLRKKGLKKIANSLLHTAILSFVLLPLTMNFWLGLISVIMFFLLIFWQAKKYKFASQYQGALE